MLFGFLWPFHVLSFFDVIAVTLQQPSGITFCTPRVENAHVALNYKKSLFLHFKTALRKHT